MPGFDDPKDPGNGSRYRTGKTCTCIGCNKPAGTAWSPHWCFKHNVERIRRINRNLEKIYNKEKGGT